MLVFFQMTLNSYEIGALPVTLRWEGFFVQVYSTWCYLYRQLEKLFAEDLLQTTNVYVLTAVIEAGRHRQALPPSANCMAASDILHT